MPAISHSFLDVAQEIHDTDSVIRAGGVAKNRNEAGKDATSASAEPWSISMRRLRGGLSDGVDVVTINNGRLKLELLPTRGMGVWRGEIDNIPVGWKSPVQQPVHPAFVDQMRRGGIGWLDGFNELICRCGLGWHGAPGNDVRKNAAGEVISEQFLPLHGRIANLAAHHVSASVSDQNGAIFVTGIVDEGCIFGGHLRLTSTLRTLPGSAIFEIEDLVTNLSGTPADVEMLYHCNIGRPFLSADAIYHGASHEVAPRDATAAAAVSMWNLFQGPTPGFSEQVYFTSAASDAAGFGASLLCNAAADHAFCVRFDTSTLPLLTLWKNTQPESDGYVTGLEPGSSFPNPRQFEREQGRVLLLPPGGHVRFRLAFEIATNSTRVRELVDEITALQVRTPRTVHSQPRPGWSR
jgi:hypothetical protein